MRSAYKSCRETDISHLEDKQACLILSPLDMNVFIAKECNKDKQFVPKKRIEYYDNETFIGDRLHGSCCYSCPDVGDRSAVALSSSVKLPCVSDACSKPPTKYELLVIRVFNDQWDGARTDIEFYNYTMNYNLWWSTYDDLRLRLNEKRRMIWWKLLRWKFKSLNNSLV